jgi:hypothetical protein
MNEPTYETYLKWLDEPNPDELDSSTAWWRKMARHLRADLARVTAERDAMWKAAEPLVHNMSITIMQKGDDVPENVVQAIRAAVFNAIRGGAAQGERLRTALARVAELEHHVERAAVWLEHIADSDNDTRGPLAEELRAALARKDTPSL